MYRAITPQSFTVAKADLKAAQYNRVKPIVAAFMSIYKYASMAEAVSASETDSQQRNIALIVISRATIFFTQDVRIELNTMITKLN